MASNIITYSIAREWLEGLIGKQTFSMRAFSGGGRGRKGSGAMHDWDSYDVFRKEKNVPSGKHTHGGPLPPGIYICRYVANHPKFHECVFLEQTITSIFDLDAQANIRFYHRDAFYIHGRGEHGSDGCIVPEDNKLRLRLNAAIRDAEKDDSSVLLKVVDRGMPLPAARGTAVHTA